MSQLTSRTFKNEAYALLAEVGRALSSPARVEILELLAQAPRTVDVLAGEIEQSVANTSHHLQALKRARLVHASRDGLHMRYALSGDDVGALVAELQRVAERHIADLELLMGRFFAETDDLEVLSADALRERMRAGDVVLIDVRPANEFEERHLPDAISIPLDALEARMSELPRDKTIVAHCRGPLCTYAATAVRVLRGEGFDARRSDVSVHTVFASSISGQSLSDHSLSDERSTGESPAGGSPAGERSSTTENAR